jgi:hypothetical protein
MRYADPYDIVGRWYKGNLHTHTTASDGTLTPADVIRQYEERGYDFLALTDHNTFTDPAPLQADTKMTLIPGFEWGHGFNPHIACLSVRQAYEGSFQQVLDNTSALGGMAILCHPNWVRDDLWPPEVMASLRYYAGIEIYNHVITRLEGSALATDDWDRLLTAGLHVWGYAAEDAHKPTDIGFCCNMVRSPTVTPSDLLYHLEHGHFYASAGLSFDEIGLRDGAIRVRLGQEAQVRFVGPGGEVLAEVSGREADYSPQSEAYVRLEAETAAGQRAWSQPFWRLDSQRMANK